MTNIKSYIRNLLFFLERTLYKYGGDGLELAILQNRFDTRLDDDDLEKLFNGELKLGYFSTEDISSNWMRGMLKIFSNAEVSTNIFRDQSIDIFLIWGMDTYLKKEYLEYLIRFNKKVIFIEDGFIRSIYPYTRKENKTLLSVSCAYVIDSKTLYYDATKESDLENLINSDFKLSDDMCQRASNCMQKIINNNISKYNHQPIVDFNFAKDKKKVLIVGQSQGDMSLKYGLCVDNSFEDMILSAMEENKNSEIIIKIHPDELIKNKNSKYIRNLKKNKNVKIIDYEINPIYLIKQVDIVYVLTSQLGFEALMCGKKVVCFGAPFYSNWGVTDDRIIVRRRCKKRSIEEIFYITYILYSKYYNPQTNKKETLEGVLDFIINQRVNFLGC
ncbi:Capsular polysaccharide export system protein KpsC [Francisella cf. novicida Fx1]|uniref:capsular polysaccharide export protein, LipB/KpsS family n=1 Tax=Francisella tularensis TaxID=263 RepID=UPI00020BD00C|nr:capsule polysaccharide transporter [Francisella tularensis]AEE87646.1 Capsular polysaccharide export system protein KpsC [Francisella cf. novicida Fx1]